MLIHKGNWNELKGKLKQKHADFTEYDLLYAEGKEDEILGKLEQKLGKSKDEVRKKLLLNFSFQYFENT